MTKTNRDKTFGYEDIIDACLISFSLFISDPCEASRTNLACKVQLICELFDVYDDDVLRDIARAYDEYVRKEFCSA